MASEPRASISVEGYFDWQKAVLEGEEKDRVFALFLLGGVATPKARDLLFSFLASPHRKERWASAIALGRLKEERVFALLQKLLLEGNLPDPWIAPGESTRCFLECGWGLSSLSLVLARRGVSARGS